MGLIKSLEEAASRQHTPKVAFVARPRDYVASSGKKIGAGDVDVLVRALSMGKLHHAMMGTASVAIATAAAVPGTLVNQAAGGGERDRSASATSGTLRVGAQAQLVDGEWKVTKAIASRSARILMEGRVRASRRLLILGKKSSPPAPGKRRAIPGILAGRARRASCPPRLCVARPTDRTA